MQKFFAITSTFFNNRFLLLSTLRKRIQFASGLFVFSILFLYLFIPFNITEWIVYTSPFKNLQLPGLGLIVGIVIFISHFLQFFLFKKYAQKVYHLLLGFLMDVILVSLPLSLLYSVPANSFWIELKETLAIVLPVAVLWYILGLSLMALWENKISKSQEASDRASDERSVAPERINIKDSAGQLRLSLKPEDLLYFESSDNYVTVHFRKNQRISREMIRNSMKNIETDFEAFNCIRCHRSFIVNLHNVSSIKKDGRAYTVNIEGVAFQIPISRGYVKSVQDHLNR